MTTSVWGRRSATATSTSWRWGGGVAGGGCLRPILEQPVGLSDQLIGEPVLAGGAGSGARPLLATGGGRSRQLPLRTAARPGHRAGLAGPVPRQGDLGPG